MRFLLILWLGIVAGPELALATVVITETTDEGLPCFRVETSTATYYYDRAGAGFTSLVDRDGNDWINFHPEGTPGVPNGQSGWFRGIPNMGLDVFGHPGYTGADSQTTDPLGSPLEKATIISTKGAWEVQWAFFDTHATMTVLGIGENYWLLYEGTPGGEVTGADICYRSSGDSNSCSNSWDGDVANSSGQAIDTEWVFFADASLDRSLVLIHNDDSIDDRYYLMNPMTVFGFGRRAADIVRLLSEVPSTFTVGLVESRDFAVVAAEIETIRSGPVATIPTRTDLDRAIDDRRLGTRADADVSALIRRYRQQ